FPIDVKAGGHSSDDGLLVMNHEYIEQEFLIGGPAVLDENGKRPADDVRKEIAAHGVSVIHIKKGLDGRWNIVQSAFNRRITGATPMQLAGPARGHAKVRTHYSPDGTMTRGTLNNCAHGYTPWGTYLTCEENWAGYFVNKDASRPKEHARFGVSGSRGRYGWELADSAEDAYVRFDATTLGATAADDYRNEPNTFGWIVEIDPFNPDSTPVKRTALGRFAHEGIVFAKAEEGKPLVCYSGDDSQFEYIYKFVSRQPYYASTAGGHLLNDGTLYVAQFNEDGTGNWLVLDVNDATFQSKMQAAVVAGTLDAPFADQGDLLINTRLAADIAGATKMDRPEWGAVDPNTGTVYFTLTNNTRRTDAQVDAANPRANNATGHIIRWDEDSEPAAVTFKWDIFLLSGDVGTATGNTVLTADSHHASPDGLWFDDRGVLWIQTDMSGSQLASGPFGNNQMLACDPNTKEIKRFLVGPPVCEVTGVVMTPDR
ncbi:MAG: PhoX family phosphatase, partial [Gammaproteobacteria bacterium]|nr:PhoX family phosphatase [Gammaproteobacteria bacterium]